MHELLPALAAFELAAGAEKVYTCEHVLVEGGQADLHERRDRRKAAKKKKKRRRSKSKSKNPKFEIQKEQRIAG